MAESEYRYAIEYFGRNGERRGSLPVVPDWGPARECAQFRAIRRGIVAPVLCEGAGRIEPVWDGARGAPVLSAVRIIVAAETGDETVCEEVSSLSYFRPLARQGSSALVERGLLEKGESYRYQVCAYPGGGSDGASGKSDPPAIRVEEIGERLLLTERPIEPLLAGATARGDEGDPDDMRVFVPQHVTEAIAAESRDAGDVETGGVLLGNLHRCHSSPEIFLEVTAQIPAAHTDSTATRLTFTADSWAAVQAAIDLRKRDELMCGWWHFHPDFCRECPDPRRRDCAISRPFFSPEDVHLHRAIFPKAFHVALLVSDLGRASFDLSLFGWRHGTVVARGFDLLGAGKDREGERRNPWHAARTIGSRPTSNA